MSEIDRIFESTEKQEGMADGNLARKDRWKAEQDKQRNELFDKANDMLDLVNRDEDVLADYLSIQARFLHYSPTNALLILAQNPHARMVRTVQRWRDDGVYIKPDPKEAIYILDRGGERRDKDGNFTGYFTNPKAVYDISSTNAVEQAKTKPDMTAMFKAMYKNSPVPIRAVDTIPPPYTGQSVAYDAANNVIFIEKGMDDEHIFKGLSKEMSLASIAGSLGSEFDPQWHEYHARCAAYMLCELYGVDNSDIDLVGGFGSEVTQKELRAELDICKEAAADVHDRIQFELDKAKDQKVRDEDAR